MGTKCCGHHHEWKSGDSTSITRQRTTLLLALFVNVGVLGLEIWGGVTSHSEAVLADAVHLLSHVLVILLSLIALKKDLQWKAKAALAKSLLVFGLGLNILAEALTALLNPKHLPEPVTMGMVAVIALAGNMATLWLTSSHRNEDINMRSTWVCSQADLLTNIGLIAASVLVTVFHAGWPDGILSLILGLLVTRSALSLVIQARQILTKTSDDLAS